jgi:hypothetical protein
MVVPKISLPDTAHVVHRDQLPVYDSMVVHTD